MRSQPVADEVVVTGGAGFVGSHLVEELLGRGRDVTVVDDFSTGTRENLAGVADRIAVIEGDVADPDVAAFCGRAGVVFHLAVRNVRASLSAPEEVAQRMLCGVG